MPPEASPTIALLCHLERLETIYKSGFTSFSLNLAAAMESEPRGSDPKDFLSPWTWKLDALTLVGAQAQQLSGTPIELELVPDPSLDKRAVWEAALDRIRERYATENGSFQKQRFHWTPAAGIETPSAERRWHAFLIHGSTYPPPLGQAMHLSVLFHVANAKLGGFDRLFVAPTITFAGRPTRSPEMPATGTIDDASTPIALVALSGKQPLDPPWLSRWSYVTIAAQPAVRAYQRECRITGGAAAKSMLIERGWIKNPSPSNRGTFARDWLIELEDRAADAFDLPLRLLDAWRAIDGAPGDAPDGKPLLDPAFDAEKTDYWKAVVATLRDLAGSGARARNDGRTLAEFLLALARRRKGTKPDASVDAALIAALTAWENQTDLDGWRALLRVEVAKRSATAVGPLLQPDVVLPSSALEVVRELERLHGLLADETFLGQLLVVQWRKAIQENGDDALKKFWAEHEAVLVEILPEVQLRRWLASALVAIGWSRLRRLDAMEPDERKTIVKNLAAALIGYFRHRLRVHPDANDDMAAFATLRPNVDAPTTAALVRLEAKIVAKLEKYAGIFGTEHLLDGAQDEDQLPPAQAPDGIVIQVARVTDEPGTVTTADDQGDPLRRISGVAILLREKGAADWSCLNLASIHVPSNGGQETEWPGYEEIVKAALVPTRLHYRDDVRQAFVTYDNLPLVAESPTAGLAREHAFDDPRPGGGGAAIDSFALFRYANPYAKNGPQLPPLSFGKRYEAAAFVVGNGGEVPSELAHVENGTPNPRLLRTDLSGFALPAGCLRPDIWYRRRVAVGSVRPAAPTAERAAGAPMQRIPLPLIPRGVVPVARAIDPRTGAAEEPLLLLTPRVGGPWSAEAKDRFEFAVRPPSVDLNVWERWENAHVGDDARTRRAQVWASYFELTEAAADKRNAADLTIDDPACARFVVRLTSLVAGQDKQLKKTLALPAVGNVGLGIVQAKPSKVTILATAKGTSAALEVVSGAITVRIPEQEVWRLEIFSQVDERDRFHSSAFPSDTPQQRQDSADGLVSPLSLLIEVATAEDLPTSEDLFAALEADTRARHDAYRLGLVARDEGARSRLRWIHRVEFLAQRWRWQGRPLNELTFDRIAGDYAADPNDEVDGKRALMDAVLFGDRSSSDHLREPAWVEFTRKEPSPPPGLGAPAADDGRRHPLLEHDVSTDPGALYYRFAVRAWSRYEGLLRAPSPVDSRDARVAGRPIERWKHLLIKSRFAKDVPPPAVKLIVPLTQREKGGETPGLLVVLAEPWFELGGLAEELDVRVAHVPELEQKDGAVVPTGNLLAQLGPDPIVEVNRVLAARKPGNEVQLAPAVGPIGFTFDTDTSAPLFVNSSFVLQPPPVVEHPHGPPSSDLSWFFVKLSVRRRLNARGMLDGNARESLFTPPVWAQYLPPFSFYRWQRVGGTVESSPLNVEDLVLDRDGTSGPLYLRKATDATTDTPIRILERISGTGATNAFAVRVLVTEILLDAFRRPSHERYRGFFSIDANDGSLKIIHGDGSSAAGTRLRARIVEVQRRSDAKETNLLDQLFPPQAEEEDAVNDAAARVVRVSDPIDVREF